MNKKIDAPKWSCATGLCTGWYRLNSHDRNSKRLLFGSKDQMWSHSVMTEIFAPSSDRAHGAKKRSGDSIEWFGHWPGFANVNIVMYGAAAYRPSISPVSTSREVLSSGWCYLDRSERPHLLLFGNWSLPWWSEICVILMFLQDFKTLDNLIKILNNLLTSGVFSPILPPENTDLWQYQAQQCWGKNRDLLDRTGRFSLLDLQCTLDMVDFITPELS